MQMQYDYTLTHADHEHVLAWTVPGRTLTLPSLSPGVVVVVQNFTPEPLKIEGSVKWQEGHHVGLMLHCGGELVAERHANLWLVSGRGISPH